MAIAISSLMRSNFSQYQLKRELWRNYALKTGEHLANWASGQLLKENSLTHVGNKCTRYQSE